MEMINSTHHTVTEAAVILGVTAQRVRQLIADDSIKAKKVHDRLWIIHRATIDKFMAIDRPVGTHADRRK